MSEERALISGDQYLGSLFMFLYQAIRKRLALMIVAILAVMAIAYFATPQPAQIYSAQAIIRNGQVAASEAMGLQATAAVVNAQSFKRRVLQSMNLPSPDDRAAHLVLDSLTARPETSDTLTLSVRAASEQQARQALDLAVRFLDEEQDKIRGLLIADINDQLAGTDANIAGLLKNQEALSDLMKATANGAPSETQGGDLRSVWLMEILSRNQETLIDEKATRHELASRLSPWKTYPTAIMGDVLVSSTPASPRPSRIAFLAGGLTFVGFVVYALVRGRKVAPPGTINAQ